MWAMSMHMSWFFLRDENKEVLMSWFFLTNENKEALMSWFFLIDENKEARLINKPMPKYHVNS